VKLRKLVIAGNWKMHKTIGEAVALVRLLKRELANVKSADLIVCPPFTALKAVSDEIAGSNLRLGAQNLHWEKEGAFTGEISAAMLRDVFCQYVIIGHSERRQYFGETDASVNRKTQAALASQLKPIVCVGETLAQRDAGQVESVVTAQVKTGLAGLTPQQALDSIVAYEPVWAIGTGRNATPEQAQEVHALIRRTLAQMFDASTAAKVRIQYGGSVKPANAQALMAQPDIDGALVGGASLDAKSFAEIVLNSASG
jgi:triosephosphate isomerase